MISWIFPLGAPGSFCWEFKRNILALGLLHLGLARIVLALQLLLLGLKLDPRLSHRCLSVPGAGFGARLGRFKRV